MVIEIVDLAIKNDNLGEMKPGGDATDNTFCHADSLQVFFRPIEIVPNGSVGWWFVSNSCWST